MARDTHAPGQKMIMSWEQLYSVPPVVSTDPPKESEQSFIVTSGIVYEIHNKQTALIQNLSNNEDDFLEFSFHGDKDGTWHKLAPNAFLRVTGDFFLLNRTDKYNLVVAALPDGCTKC